jgi:predicted nucleic acid-binding protein
MGVIRSAELADGASVLVDTNPLIYLFEGRSLAARFEPLFEDIEAGRLRAVVTPITLAELVTGALRADNEALAERYRQAVTASHGWRIVDLDAEVAMLAARLRLRHRLKLPDALQLASALREGCAAFATHDRDFAGVTDIRFIGL